MASAKITLIGLYNYDNTIFNSMVLPAGIDVDLFKQSLLMEKGEFEVLYPNPDFMKHAIQIWSSKWFRTFKEWLKGTEAEWNPIYNYDRYEEGWDDNKKKYSSTNSADYSDKRTANLEDKHIMNLKDERTADLEDKRTANLEDKRTADLEENRILNTKDERTADLEDKRIADLKDENTFNNADTTSQTKESVTEHKVGSYDSSSYEPSSQDIVNNGDSKVQHTGTVTNETTGTDTTTHSGTDTTAHSGTDAMTTSGTDTMAHTGTDTMEHSGTETTAHTGNDILNTTGTDETTHKGKLSDITGNEQNTNQHTAHHYGNIGVTTSAAMLAEFYNVAKWNLYEHMADVFSSELLIGVY